MQNFLFRKVELWIVFALFILGLIGFVGFASVVLETERGNDRFGALGQSALAVAEVPKTIRQVMKNVDPRVALRTNRFETSGGWRLEDGVDGLPEDGYLLLSRFDGATESALVELFDLRDFSLRYSWRPDADALFSDVSPVPGRDEKWNSYFFEAVHPILLPDGHLIIKDHETPLFRVDHCARKVWTEQSHIYHHSTALDAGGALWVPVHIQPPNQKNGPNFREDGLAQLSLDGGILKVHSLPDIFERNGLIAHVFTAGAFRDDPFHLNDIEPVLADGPFWKAGDLFLSLHHLSMVVLYRPGTDQILWMKQGPWLGQHDIDVLDDHRVSIFDNNVINRGHGGRVAGVNRIAVVDFASGETTYPYQAAMENAQVATFSEGLSEFTPGGNLVVEEENSGRLVIFSRTGRLLATFVNRAEAEGEKVFTLSWSRVIDRETGDAALAAIERANSCQ